MGYIAPEKVSRVASIGGGPIGGGWAAHFLARGYDVNLYLHDASEEPAFQSNIGNRVEKPFCARLAPRSLS